MLKNYIITLFRLIKRKPAAYLLNILALSFSMATLFLILQYASYHLRFDNFHKEVDNIYRVVLNFQREGRDPYIGAATFPRVGPALVDEFPEVNLQCRIVPILNGGNLYHRETHFPVDHIQYVDTTFFSLFGFEMLHGNPNSALQELHSIVISDRIAQRLFGEENPVDQTIELQTIDGSLDYRITGIFKYHENTHLKSEVLVSFSSLLHLVGEQGNTNWSWFDYLTYIRINPESTVTQVEEKLPAFIDKHGGERLGSNTISFSLQPLKSIHLRSHLNQEITQNANYSTLMFLLGICALVLVIAWINYVNLYTAKAQERSKEVGIRKTNGSSRKQLLSQFLLESGMLNLSSIVIGLLLVHSSGPFLETWLGLERDQHLWANQLFWIGIILFWVLSSLISGYYPSIVLSKMQPLTAMTASRSKSLRVNFRSAMTTWQFLSSSGLLVATFVIADQVQFMNEQSLGIHIEDTYIMELPDHQRNPQQHILQMKRLKTALLKAPGITNVSYSSEIPGQEVGWRGSSYLLNASQGMDARKLILKMTVGPDFLNDYQAGLVAGRSYRSSEDSTGVLINEAAVELYGFDSPEQVINANIYFPGIDSLRVIGVVQNFHQESLKTPYRPTAYLLTSQEIKFLSIKVTSGYELPEIEPILQTIIPNQPVEARLLTNSMQSRHQEETVFLRVFRLFTVLAILLCVVGIVGLTSHTLSKKEKEIAIRKVLGSYLQDIIWHILKEFFKLALIANLLLLPVMYVLTTNWLNGFAFHTEFNWWFSIGAFLLNLLLIISFSLFRIWKVARLNPSLTLNKAG